MLTKSDLKYLEQLMRLVVKEETNDLREKVEAIRYLPTKDEYFTREDKMMTELQNIRDDISVMTGWKDQIEDHEGRLVKVEKRLNIVHPSIS